MLATIPPPPFSVFDLGPLQVHAYGITFALGVWLGWMVVARRMTAFTDRETIDRLLLRAAGLGILGARLAYVSTHLDRFTDRPWAMLFVWEGGLAWFGGVTVGVAAGVALARRADLPILPFADAAAIAFPIGQAMGRWGNWFNQELFGTPTDLPWALRVEPEFRPAQYADAATFHPTFAYEMVANLALAAALLAWERRTVRGVDRPAGAIAAVYLAGYGAIRFAMELLRTDTTFRLLGLSRNGWVAVGVFVAGVVLYRHLVRREGGDGDVAEAGIAAMDDDEASTPAS